METVGLFGTPDPGDASKVVFSGSVVQLGLGIGTTAPVAEPSAARVIIFPTVTATLRYAVGSEGVDQESLNNLELLLRYRDGDGRVVEPSWRLLFLLAQVILAP